MRPDQFWVGISSHRMRTIQVGAVRVSYEGRVYSLSRLCQYLDNDSIQYALLPHAPISAAQDITVSVHVPLRRVGERSNEG